MATSDGIQTTALGKLTLRKKILFLMVVVIIGLISLTLFIVNFFTERAINTTLQNDLQRTQSVFEKYQNIRTKEIASENRLINEIPFLKALISTKDKATLLGFANDFQERIGSDLFLITDESGKILANTDEQITPQTIEGEPFVKNALSGKETTGILTTPNTLYQVTTAPIRLGESNLGTMTIGFKMDDSLAEGIKKMADTEISFILGDKLIASTWSGNQRSRLQELMPSMRDQIRSISTQHRSSNPFDLEMEHGKYISVLVPLTAEDTIIGTYLIQRSRDEVTRFLSTIRTAVFLVSFLMLLGASWVSYLVAKQISDPITTIVRSSKAMADGDLSISVAIKQRDEVGVLAGAFNEMARRLRNLVLQVRENTLAITDETRRLQQTSNNISVEVQKQESAVNETSSSISEMSASIQEVNRNVESLSNSATNTASSIIEMDSSIGEIASHTDNLSKTIDVTSSSIAEMTSSVKEIAQSIETLHGITEETAAFLHKLNASVQQVEKTAQESHSLSEKTAQNAQKGTESVHETIAGMHEIKNSYIELQNVISHLAEKSESIGKIVKVIAEVTQQTNLLSLNAAIIAAQAGEHGKGFGVVAEEIKNLADRTATSTQEIGKLIKDVQDETSKAVQAMTRGSERVERGVTLSNEAGDVLQVIAESSAISTRMVKEIVKASQDQSSGIRQADKAVVEIKEMVQQISRAGREQKKASGEILKAVEEMRAFGQEVRRSTQEQSKGSKLITAAVEKVTEMIEHIFKATQKQSQGGQQIDHALQIFRESMNASAQRASELNMAVATLSERSQQLEQEIGRFKI
ncbi:MAG TPA: methyl-accepting chemotaxis protein [Nitrospiria bacterium]|nr:methyl-accepting chemotaxis protein [Nitrospiria bacterium]